MPVLRSIETKIESLFEGVFGRAFRTHVQPIELARKLVKEMDDHRSVSVSRVYVPNEYTIYLSPLDRKQFAGYEESLAGELQEYLSEHARRERYALLTPPKVSLTVDDDLAVGEFGIATRLVTPDHEGGVLTPPAPAPVEPPAETIVYQPTVAPPAPAPPPEPEPSPSSTRWTSSSCVSPSRARYTLAIPMRMPLARSPSWISCAERQQCWVPRYSTTSRRAPPVLPLAARSSTKADCDQALCMSIMITVLKCVVR
jgi:hypothetical protein